MKKVFITIFMIFIYTLNSICQEKETRWKILLLESDYIIYFDTETISFKSNLIKVWLKWVPWEFSYDKVVENLKSRWFDNEKFNNYSHELSNFEIDCAKNRMNITQRVYFDKEGKVIESYKQEKPIWLEVLPESIGEAIVKEICKLKKNSR